MTSSKNTKRALLASVLSVMLCCAMLVGSTFAWFTDSVTSTGNKIQAGKLNIDLLVKDTWDGEYKSVKESKEAIFDHDKWEPGYTDVKYIKVETTGNLALKYTLSITPYKTVEAGDLAEVIDVYYAPEEVQVTGRDTSGLKKLGTLKDVFDGAANTVISDTLIPEPKDGEAVDTEDFATIVLKMQETAGNEYQGLSVGGGFDLRLLATQYTYEEDSFGTQYDKDATYLTYPAGVTDEIFDSKTDADYSIPGGSTGKAQAVAAYVDSNGEVQYTADIKTALDNGASTIYLKKNTKGRLMAFSDFLAQPNRTSDVTKDITIYANGADFEYGELAINTSEAGKNTNFTIKVYDAKNLRVWGNTPNAGVTQNIILENCTFEGKGINSGDDIASGGIFFAYGETGTINLTMNNCKVSGSNQGVYFGCDGSLTVKDSSFTECATGIKVSYKGTGTRTDRIENCVFTKCGCTTEMAGSTTYLADDSAAIKYKKSGTGTITLTLKSNTIKDTIGDKGDTQFDNVTPVIEGPVIVSNQQQANDAITNATDKKANISIASGQTITLDNGIANEGDKSRDITFSGNGSQTVDVITNAVSAEGGQLNYQRGSSFTFENLTIQAGEGNFDGIVCDELTFKDCTIKGKLTLYGKATFINCTFDNTMDDQYSIWTWGGTDVTFEKCTFNTNGKAILLYGSASTNLVVNNCTFNDRNNGTAGKAAIEIGNDYDATYTLTVNNATVNGFADGKNTDSKLWANKNSMDAAHLTVTIDGNKVQ